MRSAFVVSAPRATALRALNYSPDVESFRRKASRRSSVPLGDMVRTMGPAYGAVFTRIDCHRTHGVELLSQSDMFAAEPSGRVIRRDSMPVPENHEIKRWQVLIAGAGTLGETELYGRSLVADNRLVGRYVGPDAMVLDFLEPEADASLFTYAVLLTKAGIRAVRSTSYGTKILRLRNDLLQSLPIPLPESQLQARVASLVRTAVFQRERCAVELKAARAPIEALPEMQEATVMCADRKARCISWQGPMPTLCAWNFAAAGRSYDLLRRRTCAKLADMVEPGGLFNGLRFARIPCDSPHGVEFLSQRDLFMIRPVVRRIRHPGFDNRYLLIPQEAILLGSHGQLTEGSLFGRVQLAAIVGPDRAVTQDVLRILAYQEHSRYLFAFLSTSVGLALLRSTAIGTSIPMMHLGLLAEIPVPDLDATMRTEISSSVGRAVHAWQTASSAEAEAVRIVEEEVLPQWLA